MIYDKIDNLETYAGISERLMKGLRLLKETDFSALEPGRYEVDGNELYFMVQSYQTKESNDTPEAHKKYIDIQRVNGDTTYVLAQNCNNRTSIQHNIKKRIQCKVISQK